MTRNLAAVLVPMSLLVAGCGAAAGGTAPSGTLTAEEWQEPDDYSFAVTSSCGERAFIGDYRVEVAGGEVVASDWRDPADGEWKPVDQLEWVPTLGDMLDEVRAASADPEAGDVSLESDPGDGHPTAISVDSNQNAIDDEACYEITSYEPA